MIGNLLICVMCFSIALAVTRVLNPRLVALSYKKKLTDKPNYRKLQSAPVPIIGGMSVFLGTTISLLCLNLFMEVGDLYMITVSLMTMFFLGLLDDLMDLSPYLKFVFQIFVTSLLWFNGLSIDSLMGVFGIYELDKPISFILSLFAGVGLMNAVNMIDGVDGLSSGFGIIMSAVCGVFFFIHGDYQYATFASIFVGALVPFFITNVFSRKYKMFIGDSGSLVMGTISYIFVCRILQMPEISPIDNYRIAMTIAIFSIPVSDTLRVMTMRMLHHNSPFRPDKTHLHHIFVSLKFPHFAVTILELTMGAIIYWVGWYIPTCFHVDVTASFCVTVLVTGIISWGTYGVLAYIRDRREVQFLRYGVAVKRKTQWIIDFRLKVQDFIDKR